MNAPKEQDKKKRQPLRLPFEKRETDIGTWCYDHRVGVCITLAAYLILAVALAYGTITLGGFSSESSILIEFPREEPKVEMTPEQKRILAQSQQEDYSGVRNATSNDNAEELDSELKDDRGTNASELYEDAGRLGESLQAGKEMYERGLAAEQETASGSKGEQTADGETKDSKKSGNVTVRYSFDNPVRNKISLVVPAYMCEGGGVVELFVTLGTNGYVTAATVNKAVSTPNDCMQNSAISAANRSRFNVDPSAPKRHQGTITYTFIPQ